MQLVGGEGQWMAQWWRTQISDHCSLSVTIKNKESQMAMFSLPHELQPDALGPGGCRYMKWACGTPSLQIRFMQGNNLPEARWSLDQFLSLSAYLYFAPKQELYEKGPQPCSQDISSKTQESSLPGWILGFSKAGGKIERIWILFYFKYSHQITSADSTQLLVSCRVTGVSRACARLWMARTIWSWIRS